MEIWYKKYLLRKNILKITWARVIINSNIYMIKEVKGWWFAVMFRNNTSIFWGTSWRNITTHWKSSCAKLWTVDKLKQKSYSVEIEILKILMNIRTVAYWLLRYRNTRWRACYQRSSAVRMKTSCRVSKI